MSSIFSRELGSGPPLILIHGFCETHEIWNGFAESLSKHFRVYAIDLPGFGNSSIQSNTISIDDVGERVYEWISVNKIARPMVVGHSLGGYVTLAMAKKHPQEFAGIVLFQTTAYPDSDEKKANRNRVIEFLNTHGTDPFIDTFVPGLFFDKANAAIPLVDAIARKTPKETLLAYTVAMRDRPSSVDFLKNFKSPVLVIGGDQDSIIPLEVTKELGRMAPNSSTLILPNVGHMAMYESPERAIQTIREFASGK